jgi:hypothetical protein
MRARSSTASRAHRERRTNEAGNEARTRMNRPREHLKQFYLIAFLRFGGLSMSHAHDARAMPSKIDVHFFLDFISKASYKGDTTALSLERA